MIVISAFDGMSCGQIALNRLGVRPDKYYASEIDKYSTMVTQYNYGNTVQLGDISKITQYDAPMQPDLLIGGSPCQDLSVGGEQKGLEGERSRLFFEYLRLRDLFKPQNFLFENVRAKKSTIKKISEYLGVEPIVINSSKVSAQNRLRYYWTDIDLHSIDLFDTKKSSIKSPKDRKIHLQDVLQKEVPEKYIFSSKMRAYLDRIVASRPGNKEKIHIESQEHIVCHSLQPRSGPAKGGGRGHLYRKDGKAYCLDTGQVNAIEFKGVTRYLTPVEVCRLQTVPDDYFFDKNGKQLVSDSQIFKMCGNGWTIDVITHILSHLS